MRSAYEKLKAYKRRRHAVLDTSQNIQSSAQEVTDTDIKMQATSSGINSVQSAQSSHDLASKSRSKNVEGEERLESDEEDDVSDINIPAKAKAKVKAAPAIPHGLFILHPPPDLPMLDKTEIDIIAVHGLNGTPRGTWTDKESKTLWLQDFLPVSIPQARVMAFGYDSKLILSRARDGIEEFAKELLNQIWVLRQSERDKRRPLIFLAHSLGGIVVKKAIILAHENNSLYGHIVSSTAGIIFLATPHQGSDLTKWASLLTLISKNRLIRADLIETLKPQSSVLSEISKSFLPRTSDLVIVSFIETQVDPRLSVLIVPKESAQMGIPNEMVFPVNANHRTICRFSSLSDPIYLSVVACLKVMTEKAFSKGLVQNAIVLPSAIGGRGPLGQTSSDKYEAPVASRAIHSEIKRAQDVLNHGSSSRADTQLKLANVPGGSQVVNVRIRGLKGKVSAKDRGWIPHSRALVLPGSMEYASLVDDLRKTAPEIVMPDAFQFCGRSTEISAKWIDCFTIPAVVTNTPSCYLERKGYQINIQQPISSFFSKLFPSPITAKIERHQGRPHYISIQRSNATNLRISLMRTFQVQGETPTAPPRGFGTFPLFDTQQYKNQLPIEAAIRGGLFLPMHEQEAMYISLHGHGEMSGRDDNSVLAVRPFVGGINAITGKQLYSREPSASGIQDYVIAPAQHRIDGITVRPGIIRQFVATKPTLRQQNGITSSSHATPLANSLQEVESDKGTVEWQMSGKDEFGGIQLQVIPQYELGRIFAGNEKDVSPQDCIGNPLQSYRTIPETPTSFDVLKMPEELGLDVGDVIHIKDMDRSESSRAKLVEDLIAEAPDHSDILELEAIYNSSQEVVISITGPEPEVDPICFKVNLTEELSQIQRAAQDVLQRPDDILHAPCRIADDSISWCPVATWDDLRFLVEPNIDCFYSQQPKKEPVKFRTKPVSLNPWARESRSLSSDIDLILKCRSSRMVCNILFLDDAAEHFGDIQKPFFVEISRKSTIHAVRQMIETATQLPTQDFRVASHKHQDLPNHYRVFDHRVIDPSCPLPTLVVYNILRGYSHKQSSIPYSFTRCSGLTSASENMVHLLSGTIRVTLGTKRIFESKAQDVAGLKRKIFNSLGIDIDLQDLGLQDDFPLVGTGRTLNLTMRPPKPITLGVGAGGFVTQTIVTDTVDPRMWDVNNSQILHIHILKAEHFQAVTGLPAPESPIFIDQEQRICIPPPGDWEENDTHGKGIGMSKDEYDLLDYHRRWHNPDVGEEGETSMTAQAAKSSSLTLLEVNQTIPWFAGKRAERQGGDEEVHGAIDT